MALVVRYHLLLNILKRIRLPLYENLAFCANHFTKDYNKTPKAAIKSLLDYYKARSQARGGNFENATFHRFVPSSKTIEFC